MSYYLAIEGSPKDLKLAEELVVQHGLNDEHLTSLCLLNRGFVTLVSMEASRDLAQVEQLYDKARGFFRDSVIRSYEDFDIEMVFGFAEEEIPFLNFALKGELLHQTPASTRTIEESNRLQKIALRRIGKDAIRLRISYLKKLRDLQGADFIQSSD
jgi:hypothetical protein